MEGNKKAKQLVPYDGGLAYLLMVATYLFLSLIVPLVLRLIINENSFYYTAVCATLSIISMLVVIVCFAKKHNYSICKITNISKFDGVWLLISLMIAVGMFLGLGFVNLSIKSFFIKRSIIISSLDLQMNGFFEFLITCFVFALLPAVVEECFFRGLLIKALNGVKSWVVIVSVGLSFALYHCSLVQFFYQFIYGMLLTIVTLKAKSSIPAMSAHFVNNFIIVLLEYIGVSLDMFKLSIILTGLLVLAVGTVLLALYKKDNKLNAKSLESVKWFYLPCGGFAMFICLCLSVGVLLV